MFVADTSRDPQLARSDRLIRWGGGIAPLGLCLTAIFGRIVDLPKLGFDALMVVLLVTGQGLVWWGVRGVGRSRGWRSGVVARIWAGGIMAAWAIAFTGHYLLILVAMAAPTWATFARRRARKAAG